MIIHKLKQEVIKYTSIHIAIYMINRFLLSIFTVQVVLQILGFGIIFVLMDSFVLQHDYKLLEINYKNLVDRCDFNRDLILIKQKLDLLLENNTQKSSVIEFEIKSSRASSPTFDYHSARNSLFKSTSLNIKPPKKPSDEIPITTAGEVITLSVKK